jgi:hypothetical protein
MHINIGSDLPIITVELLALRLRISEILGLNAFSNRWLWWWIVMLALRTSRRNFGLETEKYSANVHTQTDSLFISYLTIPAVESVAK